MTIEAVAPPFGLTRLIKEGRPYYSPNTNWPRALLRPQGGGTVRKIRKFVGPYPWVAGKFSYRTRAQVAQAVWLSVRDANK